jgi:hypothetical protein
MLAEPKVNVAEIQGLYGSFSFPERLLQKIWLKRAFNHADARTMNGMPVQILHPGKWNQLGGPDFKQARLRFGESSEIIGDVELHLRASDWDAHAHARDPAYNDVVLHVVLFWPEPGYVTRGFGNRSIPVVALLPLLHHDLEEYAADEAVETLSNRPSARLTNELSLYSAAVVRSLLAKHAEARWRQKVHYAWVRVQRLGWEVACHYAALEVLGFRYNRAPMLRIAARWPLAAWVAGEVDIEALYSAERDTWSVQGVRPANQPRPRLRQYARWVAARPQWPADLQRWAAALPEMDVTGETRGLRRTLGFTAVRAQASALCGDAVGGSRLDTLICDAFLPLFAALTESQRGFGWWYHWFSGDIPPFVNDGLRQLGIWDGRSQPACHGIAQGLLGWLIEREVRR